MESLWSLDWWGFAIFIAAFTFGTTIVIRLLVEVVLMGEKFYTTPFRSFLYGDTIFLPIFAGFAALVLLDYERQG
ncbi:MAG TPA: hypothetical protein PLD54_04755, partial [Candidatus Levybacteria bacterium]|nr:hypothetical protein [Candidatus Levybacteria bacterium]